LNKGFKEKLNNNMTPYGKWYGFDGNPWCAMFVSWCADQAGILGTKVPKYKRVTAGKSFYIQKGNYKSRASGYEPKAGDVIFFAQKDNRGKIHHHTGIVSAYDGKSKTVYTIEGNSGDAIASRKYSLSSSYIDGYGKNGGQDNGTIPQNSSSGVGLKTR
jgi:hypothetical protein